MRSASRLPVRAPISLLAASAAVCSAQAVRQPILVAPGAPAAIMNLEPAIVASPLNAQEVLVAWIRTDEATGVFRVQYATSLDGLTFTASRFLPDPATDACSFELSGDPAVAASQLTGDLYVGALRSGGWFSVCRKPLHGSDLLFPAVQAAACTEGGDKEFMAIGPWPANGPPHTSDEVGYLAYQKGTARRIRSLDTPTVAVAWPTTPAQPGAPSTVPFVGGGAAAGRGHFPVVIWGGSSVGRVVLAYSPATINPAGVFDPPRWTRSDTAGEGSWAAEGTINQFGTSESPAAISGILHPPVPPSTIGFVPIPGGITVFSWPQLCTDPTDPARVWAIFVGRDSALSTNLDLFIARSDDSGATFPPANTYRIGDASLRRPHEPAVDSDEFFAAITVDGTGGINIAFQRTTDDDALPSAKVWVRYARWPSALALASGQKPAVMNLWPTPFPAFVGAGGHDYMTITSSGCMVYAAFSAFVNSAWNVYVTKIPVGPAAMADADTNGVVTVDDPAAYFSAFVASSPAADLDHDQVLSVEDATAYLSAYASVPRP